MKSLENLTPQNIIDELDAILDQERRALTKGELHLLEGFLERKEDLIGKLNSLQNLESEKEGLAEVQTKIGRNQVLLGSAMQGIKAVAQRMSELRRVRRGLDVYDRSGRMNRYTTTGSLTLEKRA